MSLTPYHLHWSDALIQRVELRLRQLHACLMEFYNHHNYATDPTPNSAGAGESEEPQSRDGPITTVGSFLLRTCVHSTPFYETQLARGAGADLALTLPDTFCSMKDIQDGLYLERRHAFLLKIEKYLIKNSHAAAQEQVRKQTKRGGNINKHNKAHEDGVSEDDDDDDDDSEHEERQAPAVTWNIRRLAFGGCRANAEKEILRVEFIRPSGRREFFHVDVHIHPPALSGRVASAAAVKRHPHYANLVQEDALMGSHLRRLHQLYSSSHSLLRATVFLKCWAHHVGLMAASSGHAEGLSGFHLSAMMLRLVEEGLVTPAMSEENAVRAVWVQMSRGFFTPTDENSHESHGTQQQQQQGKGKATDGQAEAAMVEPVAVLRLTGETMNVLFRTSAGFFTHVVRRAADEALQFQRSADVIAQWPFQPLQLRMDVAFVVNGLHEYFADEDGESVDRGVGVRSGGSVWSALAQKSHALRRIITEALGIRATYATVWRDNTGVLQAAVQLATEADGRSRLTRGPPIEDTEAVSRFNTFWGTDVTSTRQFPDGGIYRCVLWQFDEDIGTHTTLALSASAVIRRVLEFALRRHVSPGLSVSVLLGGLEDAIVERVGAEWRDAGPCVQRSLMEASREVETMISELPRGELPCKITALDIIAASERHTETFPVRPHLALTRSTDDLTQPAFAGLTTAPTIEPVHAVLTIDDRGKIPDTVEAIVTMKGAICAQLSKILQEHYGEKTISAAQRKGTGQSKARENSKRALHDAKGEAQLLEQVKPSFCIRTSCTSLSVDIIHRGYLFRLYIAHYREVSLLRALERQAEADLMERKLFWSVQHAKFLRTISFGHHSYAVATRLAKRWVSAMLLYEFVLPEAVELLVANAYLGQNAPKTPASGFLRFVQLLAMHDWSTPLVLPYSVDTREEAEAANLMRKMGEQQGMFIATPYASLESPFTSHTPRPMIMQRLVQLAKGVVARLVARLDGIEAEVEVEAAIFTSHPSAFDFQMAFHPDVLLQPDRQLTPPIPHLSIENGGAHGNGSGTASPSVPLRVWQLDELAEEKSRAYVAELVEREPASHIVRAVRAATRDRCMVFFDTLAPRAVHVITITPEVMREACQRLHNDMLRLSRGALLPATSIAGAKATLTTTGAVSSPARRQAKTDTVQHKLLKRRREVEEHGKEEVHQEEDKVQIVSKKVVKRSEKTGEGRKRLLAKGTPIEEEKEKDEEVEKGGETSQRPPTRRRRISEDEINTEKSIKKKVVNKKKKING